MISERIAPPDAACFIILSINAYRHAASFKHSKLSPVPHLSRPLSKTPRSPFVVVVVPVAWQEQQSVFRKGCFGFSIAGEAQMLVFVSQARGLHAHNETFVWGLGLIVF